MKIKGTAPLYLTLPGGVTIKLTRKAAEAIAAHVVKTAASRRSGSRK